MILKVWTMILVNAFNYILKSLFFQNARFEIIKLKDTWSLVLQTPYDQK